MTNTTPPPRKRGRPPKNNSTSPQALQMEEDIERAWELRKQGKTYREIGAILGISHVTALVYVKKKKDHYEKLTIHHREEYRETQLDDIERAIGLLWRQIGVLNNVNQRAGDAVTDNVQLARARADSLRTLNQLLERQAKLLGLDAPVQVEDVTPRDVPYIVFEFDPTEPSDE